MWLGDPLRMRKDKTDYDAIIIGSGFSGLYTLHHLRDKLKLNVRVYDSAGGVGGTWWYNRYPGARVDAPSSPFYAYTFSQELVEDWTWKETQTPQASVLAYLVHAPEHTARPSDVARFVVQTSGGLTATLSRLESAGLIERRPDPTDGRGKLIVLSEDGRRLHDTVITRLTDATAAAVADLDLDDVGTHVRDLIIALERAAGLPTSAGFVANPLGAHA